MKKHLGARKLIAIVLIILLMMPTGGAFAATNTTGDQGAVSAGEKISAEVQDALTKADYVSAIVVMKEKLDPNAYATKGASLAANHELPDLNKKDRVHHYVVMSLQNEAKQAQKDVVSYLKDAKKAGDVKDYYAFYITNVISVKANKAAIKEIASYPEVEKIVLDQTYELPPVIKNQNDVSAFGNQPKNPWNLTSISQDKVADMGIDGSGVVVGIIDSGVDLDHPVLNEGWRGNEPGMAQYSWYDLDAEHKSDLPDDYRGHGTHVCGTIMGRTDDNGNNLGVAPGAQWIAARVFTDEGATDSMLLLAGEWMLAPKDGNGKPHPEYAPDIVNNSWGGPKIDEGFYRDILTSWRAAGIVPVFSAGNITDYNQGGDGSIREPANFPESFTVGALKKDDGVAKFSLRGPSDYADVKPDISAPGVNIRSSMPGGGYGLMSGTSMACPHVSGVFALLKSAKPDATVEEMENIVRRTATPLTDKYYVDSPNSGYGYGKINAYNAVKELKGGEESFGTFSGNTYELGSDLEVPAIKHAPIKNMYSSEPITPVEAKVTDASGVKEVTLYFAGKDSQEWTKRVMKLTRGDKTNGTYYAELKSKELIAEGMKYKIEAVDVFDQKFATEEFAVEVAPGISIGYNQDFEQNTDGIIFGGSTPKWEWGKPTSGPMKAASGEKCLGTNLAGSYKGLSDAFFVLPVIDLTEEMTQGKKAALTFKHYFDLGNYEYAEYETAEIWIAEVPEDGSDPNYQIKRSFKNSNDKWEDVYIDLGAYQGKKIYVMFGMRGLIGADQEAHDGWYVDDVKVEEASKTIPDAPVLKQRYRPEGVVQNYCAQLKDPSITSYVLYRSTSPEGPFDKITEVKKETLGVYSSVYLNDSPTPQRGTYYYYATAKIGENESERSNIKSYTFTTGTPVIDINFENGDAGWTSEDSSGQHWTYGTYQIPERDLVEGEIGRQPSKNVFKGKNEGMGMWASKNDLHNFREPDTKYTLISNEMDLSQVTNGKLYFQQWFNTQGRRSYDEWSGETFNEDQGHLYFSKDGGASWTEVYALDEATLSDAGTQNQHRAIDAWFTESVDIPAEYQVSNFKMKFEFDAASERNKADCGGWYIDDILITTNAAPLNLTEVSNTDNAADERYGMPAGDEKPFDLVNMKELGAEELTFQAEGLKAKMQEIPVNAKVMIPETGTIAYTEVGTGAFNMKHPTGTYNVIVTKEGYKTITDKITIGKEPVAKKFIMEKAEKNQVDFIVTDADGAPIKDAGAFLVNETSSFRTNANASGNVTIDGVYAGEYILNVSADGYIPVDLPIVVEEGKTCTLEPVVLKKIEHAREPEDIGYDDGGADSYLDSLPDGRVAAVKMDVNGDPVVIKAVKFMFANSVSNTAEGKPFEYAIYEKNTFDGLPGRLLQDYTRATAGPAMNWTEITLDKPIVVQDDFYVAYKQVGDVDHGALLAVDENSDGLVHNARMSNGAWYDSPEQGAYMIRAKVVPFTMEKPVTVQNVKPSVSKLTVTEKDNVLKKLNASNIKVTTTYSDKTEKTVTLKDYLADGAIVTLDNQKVTAETVFGLEDKVLKVEKDGFYFTINVTVREEEIGGGDEPGDGTVDQIQLSNKNLFIKEGDLVLNTLKEKGPNVIITYTNKAIKIIPMNEFLLNDAVVTLDGNPVEFRTRFKDNNKVVTIVKGDWTLDLDVRYDAEYLMNAILSKTDLKVEEDQNVLKSLEESDLVALLTYSDYSIKQIPLKDILKDCKVTLDGTAVDQKTVYTKDSKMLLVEYDGYVMKVALTVSPSYSGGGGGGGFFPMPEPEVPVEPPTTKIIMLTIDHKIANVNGAEVINDVGPIIRDDRTLTPARFVAENLGAEVDWDPKTETVTITAKDKKIIMEIGSNIAYVNGKRVVMDTKPIIENNRTYTPARFIAEELGAQVQWNALTRTVVIVK